MSTGHSHLLRQLLRRRRQEPAERAGTSAATSGSCRSACSTSCCHASRRRSPTTGVSIGNQTVTDTIGTGCDLYAIDEHSGESGAVHDRSAECSRARSTTSTPSRRRTTRRCPVAADTWSRALPPRSSGTYAARTTGTNTVTYLRRRQRSGVNAVTLAPEGANIDYWSGVDTNFVLRAKGGLRISGGTSTGRRNVDTCELLVDDPPSGQVLMRGA